MEIDGHWRCMPWIYIYIQKIISGILSRGSLRKKIRLSGKRALSAVLLMAIVFASIQAGAAVTFTVSSSLSYGNVNNGGTLPSCYYTGTTWGGGDRRLCELWRSKWLEQLSWQSRFKLSKRFWLGCTTNSNRYRRKYI